MDLAHLFARFARRDPEAPAVGLGRHTLWTCREPVDRAQKLSAALAGSRC